MKAKNTSDVKLQQAFMPQTYVKLTQYSER